MKQRIISSLKKIKILRRAKRICFTFLNRSLQRLLRAMPLRDRVLFFSIRSDGGLQGNIKCVYDALPDVKKKVFAHTLPHSPLVKVSAYCGLLTSKVIVTDDYVRYFRATGKRRGQKVFQLWHACGAFKKFGLDAPSHLSPEEEKLTHERYDAVAVSAAGCIPCYAGAFGIAEEKCLPLGVPRTDGFFDEAELEKLKNGAYELLPALKGKTVYFYAPTFRDKGSEKLSPPSLPDFDGISRLLREDEVMVVKNHPAVKEKLLGKDYPNIFEPLCDTLALTSVCTVLVTDYSSAIYEALLMKKSILFFAPDIESYERSFYPDFPADLPGEMITDSADLLPALRRAAQTPKDSSSFIASQLSACDGHSTERCAELVRKFLKQ